MKAGSPAAQKRYRYLFPATSYDALNRLKSADFSSWSGSAWTSTLSYDLAGITYDAAGNLTALQRYRETGTLLDNLTYSNATTSNRLNSITDAVATTPETWDAETGAFTYDANGNLKTAPAPSSITAVTYDPANLPLAITRTGVTSTYRYDDAGQRITKQVGSGNTEVYLREGATTLGVFTVDGTGTPVSSYFNLVWEDRVVGRHTSAAVRSYYHVDHLGSTRAVVNTTGGVVESYDFEPWGLLMPGRTLGSGTKEGFTGKERDGETGLDYFGARYYMPALGRWAAVDPSADAMPEWSTYTYAYDNPALKTDPDGRQAGTAAAMRGTAWMQTAEWFRNMSPENQLRAMRGEIQPPNGEYQMSELNRQLAGAIGHAYLNLAVFGASFTPLEDAAPSAIVYDANGNLTKWSSSPYSISTITYDQQNLPLSIATSSGTSTYRYDEAGQRITKQVGPGTVEVYLREGTTRGAFLPVGAGAVGSGRSESRQHARMVTVQLRLRPRKPQSR